MNKEKIKTSLFIVVCLIITVLFAIFVSSFMKTLKIDSVVKTMSNIGVHIRDNERYENGRIVGYSIAYHLYNFVNKKFEGNIELEEKYKTSFIKKYLKKLETEPFDKDFKIGIIDGFYSLGHLK
jgi:hypothetical protein